MPLEILKRHYFELRNLNFIVVYGMTQTFTWKYVIGEVSTCGQGEYIVTCRGDYRRGLDLLTTYTHDSELQANITPSLISTIDKSPLHPLSVFPRCCDFTSRSLATASNTRDSSASRAQVLSSAPPVQNSTDNWSQCCNCSAYYFSARTI
jgi:hypothetical protein